MRRFLPAAFLLISMLTACRRDDESAVGPSGCVRTGFLFQPLGEAASFRAELDNAGRVSLVTQTAAPASAVRRFHYAGSTILITGSTSAFADTVTLNRDGLVISRRWSNASGYGFLERYEYEGEEVRRRISEYIRGNVLYSTDTLRYFWSSGDMVRTQNGDNIIHFEHYTDRPLSIAGPDVIGIEASLIYGVPIVRNKHLVRGWRSGDEAVEIHYNFSADGRVLDADFAEKVSGKTGALGFVIACH